MESLKLIAVDCDDIEVVSTHLQDAEVRVSDIHWRPAEKRLVVGLNRFDWETANGQAGFRRCRTALRFERVLSCKCKNLDATGKDALLSLLAVGFAEVDPPGGIVLLTFVGGGALRLEVECLEAELVDLGEVWGTECCPSSHGVDAEPIDATERG
jgi:hypothetical protein